MPDAMRLFLIEDDDDIALLIRKALERAGHQVTRCRTAADALIVLGHAAFDLVLLDNVLPDMSGLDLLQALAREGITAPTLMVTAFGDEVLATQVLRAGALDYIVKDPALTFLAELPKRVVESVTRHHLQYMNRVLIQALESGRDGVMITDLDGVILHVNQALEVMTGYSREELLGQNARLFRSGVHPPAVYEQLWRTIQSRATWQGELTNRRKDGTLIEVSLTVSPIVNTQGQMTHFVGIQRDVSERKQLERQLIQAQKMQSVGTLAGGVAHEFNNLLAGINGYASLALRETNLSPTVSEFLRNIVDLSERAAVLTRQLLAFARKPALSKRITRVADLVRATADLVGRTLRSEVQLDIQEEAGDGKLLAVDADANQLQQALVNLALNARDASMGTTRGQANGSREPGAPPAILFRVRQSVLSGELPAFPQHVPAGDYVVMAVVDNGCGMTPEVLNQALDPFFTTKEVGKGTGLGLSVVFGIVQGHQGFLTIESQSGEGTCVSIYLPRRSFPDGDSVAFTAGQVLEPETSPGRSILVVDDEEAVLDVVRRFLEIAGHKVTCAASGTVAIELLRRGQPFDLAILDVMIPHEDAVSTFQQLRERGAGMPILLCTGLAQAEPVPHLLQSGAAGYIRKPFRMNELWYAVKQALLKEVN